MVAMETILLGNQYVQYVSVASHLSPEDTIAEWVHGKDWAGKKENLEMLTSVKDILVNLFSFPWSRKKNKRMNGFALIFVQIE